MAYNYEYPYVDPGMYNDDWLLKKMKDLIAEWESMQVKFNTLEEYVKNYFANLDVQDEINNKIDSMLADGSFMLAFRRFNNPFAYSNKKFLLLGDDIYHNTVIDGASFAQLLIGSWAGVPVDLTENLSSLTGGGTGRTYKTILEEYVQKNDISDLSYCMCIPGANDVGKDKTVLRQALINLRDVVPNIIFFSCPPLIPNLAPSNAQIQLVNNMCSMIGSKTFSLYVPFLPGTPPANIVNGAISEHYLLHYIDEINRALGNYSLNRIVLAPVSYSTPAGALIYVTYDEPSNRGCLIRFEVSIPSASYPGETFTISNMPFALNGEIYGTNGKRISMELSGTNNVLTIPSGYSYYLSEARYPYII